MLRGPSMIPLIEDHVTLLPTKRNKGPGTSMIAQPSGTLPSVLWGWQDIGLTGP